MKTNEQFESIISQIKEKEIDLEQLEKNAEISTWKIGKILREEIIPSEDELNRICAALGIEISVPAEQERLSEIIRGALRKKMYSYEQASIKINIDKQLVRDMAEAKGVYLIPRDMNRLSVLLEIPALSEIKTDEVTETISKKIRGLRAVNGFTITKLSELTGISPATLDMYDAGYAMPEEQDQQKIASAFGTAVEELNDSKLPCFDAEKYPTFASRLRVAKAAYELHTRAICYYVKAGNKVVAGFESGEKLPTSVNIIQKFCNLFNCDFFDGLELKSNNENPEEQELTETNKTEEKDKKSFGIAPPESNVLANMYEMLTDDGKYQLANALWDIFEDQNNRLPGYRRYVRQGSGISSPHRRKL